MADFHEWHAYPRLWLQTLTAYSYNLARLGREAEALAALQKVQELDPADKVGAAHLHQVFTGPRDLAGRLFPKDYETRRFPHAEK